MSQTEQTINNNPLGYWCAPNGATPEYIANPDLHSVLGFILMEHVGPGWAEDIQQHANFREFVQELQVNTLCIMEYVLSEISNLEENHDLDPGSNYDSDSFGVQDYTTSALMSEEDAEKNPARQVEYGQYVQMNYEEDGDRWVVRIEYGVQQEDFRVVWWHVKMDENGWMERYEQQLQQAKKELAKAWEGDFRHHVLKDWLKLEVTVG